MEMKPVDSSNIKAIGYDPAARVMRVEFHHGGSYEHRDVGPAEHEALKSAPSVGSHYHRHFRAVRREADV